MTSLTSYFIIYIEKREGYIKKGWEKDDGVSGENDGVGV